VRNLKDLPDIRNCLYDEAEKLWWWSLYLTVGAQMSSLLAVVINNAWGLAFVGLFALVTPIVSVWLREWASTLTQQADKCRRLILYADGLGESIPKEDLATIRSWAIGSQLKAAPFTRPYYSSKLASGSNKLVDIIAESAFFTGHLAGKAAGYLQVICAISALILFSILYLSISVPNSLSIVIIVARSAISAIVFFLAGDIFLLWKKYLDLKAQANETFKVCAVLRDEVQLSNSQAIQTAEDYHLILIQSPPIPFRLYRKYCGLLNDAYRKSYK